MLTITWSAVQNTGYADSYLKSTVQHTGYADN